MATMDMRLSSQRRGVVPEGFPQLRNRLGSDPYAQSKSRSFNLSVRKGYNK